MDRAADALGYARLRKMICLSAVGWLASWQTVMCTRLGGVGEGCWTKGRDSRWQTGLLKQNVCTRTLVYTRKAALSFPPKPPTPYPNPQKSPQQNQIEHPPSHPRQTSQKYHTSPHPTTHPSVPPISSLQSPNPFFLFFPTPAVLTPPPPYTFPPAFFSSSP